MGLKASPTLAAQALEEKVLQFHLLEDGTLPLFTLGPSRRPLGKVRSEMSRTFPMDLRPKVWEAWHSIKKG